ncbi:MAG: hypothetical protein Q4D13_02550 [Erysipelotrichaceae bacterium]|nr:hypothetical protein [Erysipelotrichaceae bacterium]
MLKREFTLREKILILVLAILALILLYVSLIYIPVNNTIRDNQDKIDNLQSAIMIEEVKNQRLHNMEEAISQAEKDDMKPIADYDNATNVITYLNTITANTSNYQLSFKPVSINDYLAVRAIDMSFTCDSYVTAENIVGQLEYGPYYARVLELNINNGTVRYTTGSGTVSVNLTVVFFEYAGN